MIQKNLWWFATAAAAANGEQDFGNTQLALLLATDPDKEIHVYHTPHGTSKGTKLNTVFSANNYKPGREIAIGGQSCS